MKPTEHDAVPHHHSPEELHNDDVAHEHSDVNVRAILLFGIGIVVVTLISAGIVWGVFEVLEMQAKGRDPHLSPIAMPATEMPARTTATPTFGPGPEPRLLTNEPMYLQQVRRAEEQSLHQYGWADQSAGIARMPIEEAKKLILQRGLAARSETVTQGLGRRIQAYGEASGGRTITTSPAPPTPSSPAPAAPPKPAEPHKGGH